MRDDDLQNNQNVVGKRDIGEDSTRSSKRQHENKVIVNENQINAIS